MSKKYFPKISALEIAEAKINKDEGGKNTELQKIKQEIENYKQEIFVKARKHLLSNFPSFNYYTRPNSDETKGPHIYFHINRYYEFCHHINKYLRIGHMFNESVFHDKLVFDGFINKAGYNSPKLHWIIDSHSAYNVVEKKRYKTNEILLEIMDGEFFVKPQMGEGGHSTFLISQGNLFYTDGTVEKLTQENLLKIFRFNAKMLLQDKVKQIDALNNLNPTSLNTIRCLTYLDNKGKAHVLGATLRMGGSDAIVDNASSGGIYCGIDIHKHTLFPQSKDKNGKTFDQHPTSSINFQNYSIPKLDEVFQTCIQLHQLLRSPVTIGWDIAITEEGPLIIEANTHWMGALHARADSRTALRFWSLYLDNWNHYDVGFDVINVEGSKNFRDQGVKLVLRVEGKVQGVGYRNWILLKAKHKMLAGSVQNLQDGAVRLVLEGSLCMVEVMLMLVATGPAKAKIENLTIESVEFTNKDYFSILT